MPGVASDGCGYEAAVANNEGAMRRPGYPLERVVVCEAQPRLIHAGWTVARTVEDALR
jgi:hypothetical protein